MSLTKTDLKQIGKVVNTAIDTRVPKIVDERINASVPKIVDERINASVPKIVDERINASVPKIVDERINASVPKMISIGIQGAVNEISQRIDELEEEINEKISHLPSKQEFFDQTDKLVKEIRDLREETTVVNGRSNENREVLAKHEKRISKLETRLVAS